MIQNFTCSIRYLLIDYHSVKCNQSSHKFKCIICDDHVKNVHEKGCLLVTSLNICRGLFNKEELLSNTINELNCGICNVCEVDIEDFDEQKPFTIIGYNTYFPIQRLGTSKTCLLCFVKDSIEVKMREDLMPSMVANVWLEIQGKNQKMLICLMYQESNDLTSKLSIENQIERLKIFSLQIEEATKEGMVLAIGDMNIDLEKLEDSKY